MKFLCPNCKAKYRIGPEKMVGRQAAKIRCRKCEYLIQIAYRPNSDEFDVTASPPSVAPAPPSAPPPPRAPKGATAGQPVTAGNPGARARLAAPAKDEGIASKKPTAAVPGLPGLGSPKSRSGAALLSDASALGRRPLAPLPPPPVPPIGALGVAPSAPQAAPAAFGGGLDLVAPAAPLPPVQPPPGGPLGQATPQRASTNTQLGDQFRESVQAGGAVEDLPQEGWFVGVNGVPLGPIPLGDLRELAMAGHIDRRSLVWRDGQAEWRPLGKFPGLARVIDDGAAPSAQRPDPSPVPAPAAPRPNGANGHAGAQHVASGFDVPRADAGERPSVWGDLDDEDDEDEQPTTVKGRVSVMPTGGAPPSVSGLPLPSSPSSLPVASAPAPFGVTSSAVAAPAPLFSSAPPPVVSLPPIVSESAAPISIISAIPDSMDDGEVSLRRPGRSKWYLIAVAIVFAFVLGAIVTHLMRASSSEKTSSESSSEEAVAAEAKKPQGDAEPGSRGALSKGSTSEGSKSATGPEREARTEAITASLRPGDAEEEALDPAPGGWDGARALSKPSATGSLLAGLGSPRAPGPGPARDERVAGAGLDATAIQRTVRRYSPAVRQNCWLRALDARRPGVPTSAKLTATISVEANGRVQAVDVNGAPRGYPSLSRCVENAVKGWQFPRSGAQTITNVPFMFMGQ